MDNDRWGLGYKIVTNRIGAHSSSGVMNEEEVTRIVDGLFPTHPETEEEVDLEEDHEEFIPELMRRSFKQQYTRSKMERHQGLIEYLLRYLR